MDRDKITCKRPGQAEGCPPWVVNMCVSVEGSAPGGVGGEPADLKLWGWGLAPCASTCALGDADAYLIMRCF